MFNPCIFRVHTFSLTVYAVLMFLYLGFMHCVSLSIQYIFTNMNCMPLPNYRLPTPQEREKWKHIFDTIIDPNLVYIVFLNFSFLFNNFLNLKLP
jgi:hypothetical protein